MNNICKLLIGMMAAVCCTSCNNEWEDEQFKQLASFKAEINNEGVTSTYVRYKPGGVVTYQLPVLLSGSTMNTQARTDRRKCRHPLSDCQSGTPSISWTGRSDQRRRYLSTYIRQTVYTRQPSYGCGALLRSARY